MAIFITSDTHFGHDKDFLYKPRGFETIQEHDERIIENWNKIIGSEDIVYHLGDVMLGKREDGLACLSRLNGDIRILTGNHDTINKLNEYQNLSHYAANSISTIGYATIIKYKKWNFYLSHYPTVVGGEYNINDKLFCLCGHSHSKNKFQDINIKSYHCELDAHNNTPVLLDDIIDDIKNYNTQINLDF